MSNAVRPKPVSMTICDLCDQEISGERMKQIAGKLAGNYLNPDASPSTPRVYLLTWPKGQIEDWRSGAIPSPCGPQYDFHYECIEKLVREAVAGRTSSDAGAS